MSDPATPLSEQEREELVAYLDGELRGQAAQAVQAKLSLDPRYRAEAEAMRRTWEMLDFLPRAEPSPTFSHKTLDRVSALRPSAPQPAAGASPGRPGVRSWRWLKGVGWAAAVLLAVGGGFAAVSFLSPRDSTDEDLAHELRVIENKRFYEHVDDIDFLWQLDHPDLFGDDSGG
jgi:anti-sigma factor RsiW